MQPINIELGPPPSGPSAVRPGPSAARTCFLVDGVLDGPACARIQALAEARGFSATGVDYPPSYRDNDRLVLDDPALAAGLFARLAPLLPARVVDDAGAVWELVGLNDRFRFCRYRDGQGFRVHRDGAHAPGPSARSRFTCQIYLNDAASFEGGATRFYEARHAERAIGAVTPRAGTAVIFDHDLWHDGEPVRAGTKYVMRTDVIYARARGGAESELSRLAPPDAIALGGHLGYVWKVLALANGSLASAARDRTIRLWSGADEAWSCSRTLRGHTSSVTSLVEPRPGLLWSGARDGTILAWDLASGASSRIGAHAGAVLDLELRADGSVASASADGTIGVWSAGGERLGALTGHTSWVWCVADLGANLLASGGEDGTVRIWCATERASAHVLEPQLGPIHAVIRLDDHHLAAGCADGSILVLEVDRPGRRLVEIRRFRPHRGEIYALAALPGGLVASGGEDATVCLNRTSDGALVATHRDGGFVRSLARIGNQLASGSYDSTVRIRPLP